MPDMGFINVVEDKVRQGDRINGIVFFPAIKGAMLEGFQLVTGFYVAVILAGHVLEGLGKEPPGAAAGVIDGFTDFRVNYLDHGPDNLTRSKKLAAIITLFPHFQQESLIDLGKGNTWVGSSLFADFMHLIQHIKEVALVSIWVRSTPDMIWLITFCREVAWAVHAGISCGELNCRSQN